jgi:hypothetical protein
MASGSPVQKERIDQAMSQLEKLKQEIASIESKYRILDGQYSAICDEALAIVNDARDKLQQNVDSTDYRQTETTVKPLKLKREPVNGSSLEDVYQYYRYQPSANKQPCLPPPHKIPVIDPVGDAIELGLDKLGDALIYPFDAIVKLQKKIIQSKPDKKREPVK